MSFLQGSQDRWPLPKFDENDQPHFLFIITPPYSGSTALAELLNTSHRTMILQSRGEGQWLIPGLCEADRWDPKKEVNYLSIKATWLNVYQQVKRLTQNIDVVIEKSPPNMMRLDKLSSQFRDCSFIANNRDPYANCASILYRHHDADNLSLHERKGVLSGLVKAWVMRSNNIQELVLSRNIPLLTYESFCRQPSAIIDMLKIPKEISDSINPDANVRVKDYKLQPISNQNERQILKLSSEEIEYISEQLSSNRELLKFFGYRLLR